MSSFEFPFIGEKNILNSETRAELEGEFIALPDGVTHYELSGPETGPLVALVHGFSVPYFIWDSVIPSLIAAGFRVLRFDLFGRGYSDRPKIENNKRLFVRQLDDLLTLLKITEPINLIGLSMGGIVVGEFSIRFPNKINKLMLIDPAGFPLKYSGLLQLVKIPLLGEILFSLLGTADLEKSMATDFFDHNLVQFFIEKYRPQMTYKGFKWSILSSLRNGILDSQINTYQEVGKQNFPVQLIWGKEDRTIPFKYHIDMLAAIPRVEFHAIDEAGHIPYYEKPNEVLPLMTDFLKRK